MFRWVLSGIVASLVISSGAFAQLQTSDDFEENFQSYPEGSFIVEESVYWAGALDAGTVVATNYAPNYVGNQFPLTYDRTAQQALRYDSVLTNQFDQGQTAQTNWVDMVLNPTFSETGAPDLPPQGTVGAVYFSSNGYVNVTHTPSNNLDYVEWVETDVQIGVDDWIRLTIVANLQDGGNPFLDDETFFYQVYVNGEAVTNEAAFQEPSRASGGNGSWFGAYADDLKEVLEGTVFQGTGYIDDVVVKNQSVFTQVAISSITWPTLQTDVPFDYGDYTIGDLVLNDDGEALDEEEDPIPGTFSIDEDPSLIPPAGTNTYVLRFEPDDTAAFTPETGGSIEVIVDHLPLTVTASNIVKEVGEEYVFMGNEYFTDPATLVGDDAITNVVFSSDGADESAAAGDYDIEITAVEGMGLENYDMTWVDGTMTVESDDPGTGPSQTWLDAFGWDEADLDEPRQPGDTMTRREAWLASVDPSDTNDMFRVSHIWQEDGTNYIEWVSKYVDDTLPPFAIWARTNLMDEAYHVRGELERTAADPIGDPVTNTWYEAAPEYPVFYRIAGTNVVEEIQ